MHFGISVAFVSVKTEKHHSSIFKIGCSTGIPVFAGKHLQAQRKIHVACAYWQWKCREKRKEEKELSHAPRMAAIGGTPSVIDV